MALTPKQERFVQGIVAGLSQRQAYIKAGYSTNNKTDNYIDVEASKLFSNPKVFHRYQELMDEHKEKALWTREEAVEALKWLYNQGIVSIKEHDEGYVRQGTSSAILGAIQELNKLEDLYPSEKSEIELSGGVVFIDDVPEND
ncbi:terminase small subunit [Aerococcaceae bacterium DSM 111020]|nr:terminase small subunit [Aerococcaceae bacterium DSM 111020]